MYSSAKILKKLGNVGFMWQDSVCIVNIIKTLTKQRIVSQAIGRGIRKFHSYNISQVWLTHRTVSVIKQLIC